MGYSLIWSFFGYSHLTVVTLAVKLNMPVFPLRILVCSRFLMTNRRSSFVSTDIFPTGYMAAETA